ncbi:YpuI family protein [Bacillus sp. 1P06AnD]|uniref:YpuI family protein n=1 Tax=Bacillus sp. 1P06AnD TaxID=3132208 RepID=UPI0039A3A472
MGNSMVQLQLEEVKSFLGESVERIGSYLNNTTIHMLLEEQSGDEAYYTSLLATVRRLAVYCEEGFDACKIVLSNSPFHKGAAEKTLYKVFHQCIEEFFSPKNDAWFEDSRSAYTGKNSIKYHHPVPASFSSLIKDLEGSFQNIREELEYYETDYRTKMLQSK